MKDTIFIDDDEVLFLRAALGVASQPLSLETEIAKEYLKVKGLDWSGLRSPADHGSYKNVRNRLKDTPFVERKRLGNTYSITVTALGLQALMFREKGEVFQRDEGQYPREGNSYLDRLKPAVSPRAKKQHELFEFRPMVTVDSELGPLTTSISLGASEAKRSYFDQQGFGFVANATGISATILETDVDRPAGDLEGFQADFSDELPKRITDSTAEMVAKHKISKGRMRIKIAMVVELTIVSGTDLPASG